MGIIAEVIEGFLNWTCKLFKRNAKISGWEKLHPNQVPNWVERSAHKFHKKHPVKNHDLRKDFRGNHFIYRVYFKKVAHGRIREEYWRKKK